MGTTTTKSAGVWSFLDSKPHLFFRADLPKAIVKNGARFEVWVRVPEAKYVASYTTFEAAAMVAIGKRATKGSRVYDASGEAGCIEQRTTPSGLRVGLYDARQAGLDPDAGAYTTLCIEHGGCVNHDSLSVARAWLLQPESWCPDCQDNAKQFTRRT